MERRIDLTGKAENGKVENGIRRITNRRMDAKQREYHRNYYRVYREQSQTWKGYKKAYNEKKYLRIKNEVFDHYGRQCVICGENRFNKLSIDHPNNDGGEHRKNVTRGAGGINFYIWLQENGYPEEYQVLCISCNCRKNALWMWKNGLWKRKPKTSHYDIYPLSEATP